MRNDPGVARGDWVSYVTMVRRATGLKTGQLATRAGVSPETWWRWEKGRQRPREVEVVERFAAGFGLPVDQVLWAAGLAVEEQPQPEADPRLEGLDPEDPAVRYIMDLDVDEKFRDDMLDRLRENVARDRQRRLEEIEFWARRRGTGAA